LTGTPAFGKTAALLQLEGNIHLTKNAVYKRIRKSDLNGCVKISFRGVSCRWKMRDKRVCLIDARDQAVYGEELFHAGGGRDAPERHKARGREF
jgi:hypothetical protein